MKHRFTFSILTAALVVATSATLIAQDKDAKVFRAGAATSVITPPLGTSLNGSMRDKIARHVHDDLHARCIVLDDGKTKLAFVVNDSCMIPREVFDEAKRLVQAETGLPAENMMMSATHSHTTPTVTSVFQSDTDYDYKSFLIRRIADTVRRALNNLEPARIGWASGSEPSQVFNRRWYMKPEVVLKDPFGNTDKVRMNPPSAHPTQIKPAGPTDPEVYVLSLKALDGRNIGVLANYSLHYVGGTGSGHVSADYFGMFADRVQQLLEADRQYPPFVGIMSNGTSGDINNINFFEPRKRQKPYEQMRIVANTVAAEAYKTIQEIQYQDWVELGSAQKEITLGVRKPKPEEIPRAKKLLEAAANKKIPRLDSREEIYAGETMDLLDYPDNVDLILQTFQIGDLGVAAIPCETFVEIGIELKQRSPFGSTFTVSLANGYNGYLPTVKHHGLGGYETWRAKSSYLEVNAEPQVVKTLLELFGDLKK